MSRPTVSRRARPAVAVAVAALSLFGARPADGQRRIAVLEEPHGTVVAVSVLLNAGGIWEPAGQAGVSRVAARAVIEEIRPQLLALNADATTTCEPAALRFTLLASPATWRVAADILLHTLFERAIDDAAIETARTAVLRDLERERGNPEHDIPSAVRQALYGSGHRWARTACGETATVAALEPDAVRALMRARFLPSRAAAAVAGPVDRERAPRLLADALGDVSLPVVVATPANRAGRDRLVIPRRTVTAWVGIAYPLPDDPNTEALRLLGHALERRFEPGARHPDLHALRTVIERHGKTGAFVVYLVATAETADAWTQRVREEVASFGRVPIGPETFDVLLHVHRGRRFRALASPEARARAAVEEAFFDHRYTDPADRIDALTTERLRVAAERLGAPSVAVLGPR